MTTRRVGQVSTGGRERAHGVAYRLDRETIRSRELALARDGDALAVTVGCRTVRLTREEAAQIADDLRTLLAGEDPT